MRAQLLVAVIVGAFDCGLLDRAVHPLELTVGPGVVRLVAPDVRQARDSVRLRAAVQRRTRQVRDRWLKGIEASAAPSSGSNV